MRMPTATEETEFIPDSSIGGDRQPLGKNTKIGCSTIHFSNAELFYDLWPSPICIVSDGPYGLSGYPGDLNTVHDLAEWYLPHLEAWSARSTPQTTLWFWNSELGWATVHPVIVESGWDYRCCHIWDKGIGHVAGNSNTRTLRKYPVTTEVCVQYVKRPQFYSGSGEALTMQEWLRNEWKRSGLPLRAANDACGTANAATRKYLTSDHLWYFPPPEAFALLATHANSYGRPEGRPYFSIDGNRPVSKLEWSRMRAKFKCRAGVTNVWRKPHVGGNDRVNGERQHMRWKFKSLHGSQKPLDLISMSIDAATDKGDVVWEPFGGLCPAAVVSLMLERECYSAEVVEEFYDAAAQRLEHASKSV